MLKVGHHGSRTSSSDELIKAIAPKYAAICCGKDNKYGYPHKETSNILNKYKVTTYRTNRNENIMITSDGKELNTKVSTEDKNVVTNNNVTPTKTQLTKITTTSTINKTIAVYVTKSGKKYHKDSCSGLSKSKIAISLEEVKKKGYTACSKCN